MAKKGCRYDACPYRPVGVFERVVVTAVLSGVVLAVPLANAIGLGVKQSFTSGNFVFSVATLLPVLAWIGSIYVAYKDDVDHHWTVMVNAVGLPGTFLALMLLLSK